MTAGGLVAVDTGRESGDRSDGVEDLEAIARAETAALKAAIAAVKASGRKQRVDEVEAGLVRELRARRLFVPSDEINLLARGISDPLWARKGRSRISSRRTLDGLDVEVRIDPWSRRRARKLQRIAAPTVIMVVPYDSQRPAHQQL